LGAVRLKQADLVNETADKVRLLTDAEPLLVQGYEGLKQLASSTRAAEAIPEALDRLIELYTALDKPEEVGKYRELRDQYRLPEKTP
jgi:hypothetical protein